MRGAAAPRRDRQPGLGGQPRGSRRPPPSSRGRPRPRACGPRPRTASSSTPVSTCGAPTMRRSLSSGVLTCTRRLPPALEALGEALLFDRVRAIGARPASPQDLRLGKTLPGLQRPVGLKASFSRCMNARSASEKINGMKSAFSSPMPCSPEIEPPTSAQTFMISRARRHHPRLLAGLARIVEDVRVQVAVAGVEDVADAQAVRGRRSRSRAAST